MLKYYLFFQSVIQGYTNEAGLYTVHDNCCFSVGLKQETHPAMKRARRSALHPVKRDCSQLMVSTTPAHTLTGSHYASLLIR